MMISLGSLASSRPIVLKAGLVGFVKGHPPIMAMEFARRMIPHAERPTFLEMEKTCKGKSKDKDK